MPGGFCGGNFTEATCKFDLSFGVEVDSSFCLRSSSIDFSGVLAMSVNGSFSLSILVWKEGSKYLKLNFCFAVDLNTVICRLKNKTKQKTPFDFPLDTLTEK